MQQKMGMLNLISIQARQHRYEQDKDAAEDGSAKLNIDTARQHRYELDNDAAEHESAKLNIDTGKTTSIMSKTRQMKPGRTRH